MKQCNRKECKQWKPLSEFNKDKGSKDGYADRCRECTRLLQRKDYNNKKLLYRKRFIDKKRERVVFLHNYKMDSVCIKCGENHIATLDFHHRDPSIKKKNLYLMCRDGYSFEKIKKEIDKCDVLCSNCHRKLHWKLNGIHNIYESMYWNKGGG